MHIDAFSAFEGSVVTDVADPLAVSRTHTPTHTPARDTEVVPFYSLASALD